MLTFHINITEVSIYLSILLRMSLILFMTPMFSNTHIPAPIKALVSFLLADIMFLLPHKNIAPLPLEPFELFRVVIGEVLFGMIVSFAILIIFAAFEFAGELISYQMGFGFAQMADPVSGIRIGFLSGWFQLVATMMFFALNGHHMLIKLIFESFQAVPIGGFVFSSALFAKMLALLNQLFVIGIKIAAPTMIVLLLTHVGFGLITKFAPQINIMSSGFGLNILLGFLFLGLSVSIWFTAMENYLGKLMQFLRIIMG